MTMNLGGKVTVDFKLNSQIGAVVKYSFFQLRQLAKTKPSPSRQHSIAVIHNALYSEVSGSSVARLQREKCC